MTDLMDRIVAAIFWKLYALRCAWACYRMVERNREKDCGEYQALKTKDGMPIIIFLVARGRDAWRLEKLLHSNPDIVAWGSADQAQGNP